MIDDVNLGEDIRPAGLSTEADAQFVGQHRCEFWETVLCGAASFNANDRAEFRRTRADISQEEKVRIFL
jgi:hypothetical protein